MDADRMERRVLIVWICVALGVGAALLGLYSRWDQEQWQVTAVPDVTRQQTLVVGRYADQGTGNYNICLEITGTIDGTAVLEFNDGYGPWTIGPGEVDILLNGGDFYMEECEIEYTPSGVRSGSLTFRCRFDHFERFREGRVPPRNP